MSRAVKPHAVPSVQTLDLRFSPIYRQRRWGGDQTIDGGEDKVFAITEIKATAGGATIEYNALDGEAVTRETDAGRIVLFFPIYTSKITLPADVIEAQGFEVHTGAA